MTVFLNVTIREDTPESVYPCIYFYSASVSSTIQRVVLSIANPPVCPTVRV